MPRPMSRREMLGRCATGFGAVALSSCSPTRPTVRPSPRSRRVSRITTPRPRASFFSTWTAVCRRSIRSITSRVSRRTTASRSAKINPTQFDNIGKTLKSPWNFKQYGQSGLNVSDLFPHVGEMADELCVVRSMTSKFSSTTVRFFCTPALVCRATEHGRVDELRAGHRGNGSAWLCRAQRRPDPVRRLGQFGNGFLPASHQATVFKTGKEPLADIRPREAGRAFSRPSWDC